MSGAARARVREMVRKEFRQVFRDPRMKRVILVAPIVQLLVFGYAVSTDVRHTPLLVCDQDGTASARELTDAFTSGGYFDVVARTRRSADVVTAMNHGTALAALVVPVGFERDLGAGRARVQLVFDGTNSNTATVAKGYAERIVATFAQAHSNRVPPVDLDVRMRAWYNPDLASRNYNVPAVIGAILLLICMLMTALAIVREREIGTLEQLLVSPLRPGELIVGKTIPFAVVGLVDLALISTVALLWFRIPFRGNPLLLLGAALLFLLCGLGGGLLISTVSKTQQEAFLSSFLVFMPTMLLSGFMFPVSSMPKLFQWLTLLNPLRHFLEIVRGVFLKGAGAADFAFQLGALALIGGTLFSVAVLRVARQKD
jgi:drug efflux transport system permease protein